MDVVIEITDYLLWDRLYATVYPVSQQKLQNALNAGPNATIANVHPGYHFEPASKYVSISPGQMAYMSEWARDDPYRQACTLFLVLW
jgi:lathosterol oxidase